jgi:hypothetical protein
MEINSHYYRFIPGEIVPAIYSSLGVPHSPSGRLRGEERLFTCRDYYYGPQGSANAHNKLFVPVVV